MEWDVQKGKPHCEGCGSVFLDNQPYQCLLRLDAEPWNRKDYCQRCWVQEVFPTLAQCREYAAWSARYKIVVPPPKEEAVGQDHAEIVFRKLLGAQDVSKKNVLFVLAVMLERKKILKQQKVVRESLESAPAPVADGVPAAKILVYTHAKTGESITIEDPQIRLSQWGQTQMEVKQLLEEELALLGGEK